MWIAEFYIDENRVREELYDSGPLEMTRSHASFLSVSSVGMYSRAGYLMFLKTT